jgi:hypothetical protein
MKRENILFLQVQNIRLMLDLNTQYKKGCPNHYITMEILQEKW